MLNDVDTNRVAQWAAHQWMRKLPRYRHALRQDLEQEAYIAIILARRTYKQELGSPLSYARSAAIRHLTSVVARGCSPASCASSDEVLALALTRGHSLSLPSQRVAEATTVDGVAEATDTVWRSEVRGMLNAVVGHIGPTECLLRILAGESKAAAEAEAAGLPVAQIYQMTREARDAITASRALFRMWAEK